MNGVNFLTASLRHLEHRSGGPRARLRRRAGPGARRRQRAARAARLGRRFRRLVQLQVPQRRARGGRRLLRPRAARHNTDLPRLAGWWGNDPATRFAMHLEPNFVPKPGADGWQISNPPILAMAPLRASLGTLRRARDAGNLRAKSQKLTELLGDAARSAARRSS